MIAMVAATCAGMVTGQFGPRRTYVVGALVFAAGASICWLATSMAWVIAGRFVQGFGGGLLIAVAYVVVRRTFPEHVWTRALSLLSGVWSVSILVGPLAGGAFVRWGDWRSAFATVAVIGVLLALGAARTLPGKGGEAATTARVPAGRVLLICLAIGAGMPI